MKHLTINRVKRTFEKEENTIYLAGPFFNPVQLEWAQKLKITLNERGYLVRAPVSKKFTVKNEVNAFEAFERNIEWMLCCDLVLAQIDFPMIEHNELCVVNKNIWQYEPVNLPDSGTVFEMGYCYANKIPIIGYTLNPTMRINLMLAQCLTGFCYENPLDIFQEQGINWNLIGPWKGEQT